MTREKPKCRELTRIVTLTQLKVCDGHVLYFKAAKDMPYRLARQELLSCELYSQFHYGIWTQPYAII